ncbi:Small nuclear ribonucleoprotein E [Yarrowia sp. B02]|nr:Small nuclear ribonucleoprotein E [Yarrowia sp. B02]
MSDRLQQRVMLVPIKVLFKFLQLHATVQVWLFEQSDTRIQGTLVGFDEFMNVVLEDAVQICGDKERQIGKILLKGDNITLISNMS